MPKQYGFLKLLALFIHDVNGSADSKHSGIYKCRKCEFYIGINITSIVTTSDIPISITLNGANKYDSTGSLKQLMI